MVEHISVKPIGIVHVDASDEEVREAWFKGGLSGIVEVYPEYERGLQGIEGFSHLLLVTWLHKVSSKQRHVLVVKPRRFLRLGFSLEELPVMGVFASDSPHRPNPIGLTVVKLVEKKGRFLYVDNLDLFDGTPVLDIRAITPDFCPQEIAVPQWFREFKEKIKEKTGEYYPV